MSDLIYNVGNILHIKANKKEQGAPSTRTIKVFKFGVKNVGQSSPTLTRISGDTSAYIPTQADMTNFFVADTDVSDSLGNHFVKLKKFYVSITEESDGTLTYKVAHTKLDDTFFLNPYFKDKDGNEIDYAYYGKYKGNVSSSKLRSVSGVYPTYSTTIDDYRTYARNNGAQYHQTDWCAVFTAQIMLMCVYATTQATNILTYRSYGSTTGSGTQILGIEDIIGNGYEDVDGVVFRSGSTLDASSVSWADKISDYASGITTNQTTLTGATGSSGSYISKMYYVSGKPALSIFPKALSGSSSTYYCDCFYFDSSNSPNLSNWGADSANDCNGLFYMNCNNAWSNTNSYIGSRLHCKILG